MSIEEIKKRLIAYMASFKNYNEKHHETVEDEFRFHAPSDIEFLLAENQRLVEERDSFQRVGIKVQEANVRLVEALEAIPTSLWQLVHEDGYTMVWEDVEKFTRIYVDHFLQANKLLEKDI